MRNGVPPQVMALLLLGRNGMFLSITELEGCQETGLSILWFQRFETQGSLGGREFLTYLETFFPPKLENNGSHKKYICILLLSKC